MGLPEIEVLSTDEASSDTHIFSIECASSPFASYVLGYICVIIVPVPVTVPILALCYNFDLIFGYF